MEREDLQERVKENLVLENVSDNEIDDDIRKGFLVFHRMSMVMFYRISYEVNNLTI